jgi:hypothetical protein
MKYFCETELAVYNFINGHATKHERKELEHRAFRMLMKNLLEAGPGTNDIPYWVNEYWHFYPYDPLECDPRLGCINTYHDMFVNLPPQIHDKAAYLHFRDQMADRIVEPSPPWGIKADERELLKLYWRFHPLDFHHDPLPTMAKFGRNAQRYNFIEPGSYALYNTHEPPIYASTTGLH